MSAYSARKGKREHTSVREHVLWQCWLTDMHTIIFWPCGQRTFVVCRVQGTSVVTTRYCFLLGSRNPP